MSRKEATAHLRKLDAQLMKWTRFLYGVEWQDPSLYDVVLNLDHINIDGAATMLAQMTRLDDFQPTDASRKAFENLCLSSFVWAALTKDQRTRTANIRVAADAGAVYHRSGRERAHCERHPGSGRAGEWRAEGR